MKSPDSAVVRQRQATPTGSQRVNVGRRRPTIPTGIVTTRLGQLKTLNDDNGSIIRYKYGNGSSHGRGGRAKGGLVIPASRSTFSLRETPRSRDESDSPPDADRSLKKRQAGGSKFAFGPRAVKSQDGLVSHAPASTTEHQRRPLHDTTCRQILCDERAAQPTTPGEYASYWVNSDGALDDSLGTHLCHSCGEWISVKAPCASCGHAFCSRCTADLEGDSSTSQTPTGNSEVPSSSSAPQQPSDQSEDRENNEDAENDPWSSGSQKQVTSMSSSSRTVPRAKTLSSLFLKRPARHCICCIARQPARRQTVAALPGAGEADLSSTYSGSSTATHTTARSNMRRPETPIAEEEDLRPAALQPRRSTEARNAIPLKTRSSDPYFGLRAMRPHPHPPSPETENWPKLRQVPVSSNARPNTPSEETPWRSVLRKVSRPATGEPDVYQKPTTKPEWVANLRKVRRQSAKPISPNEEQWQPPTPSSPLNGSKQERAYCDGNISVSARPSERPASSKHEEPLPQCDHNRILTKSPSLASRISGGSLKRVESSLTRNSLASETNNPEKAEQRRQADGTTPNKPRAMTLPPRVGRPPSIMKIPGRGKSRDQHSCHWRDRFMDLSAEVDQLRSELDTCEPGETSSAHEEQDHECDDAGIDGLTVVIHLKGRDDLVINTDLRT